MNAEHFAHRFEGRDRLAGSEHRISSAAQAASAFAAATAATTFAAQAQGAEHTLSGKEGGQARAVDYRVSVQPGTGDAHTETATRQRRAG